MSNFIRLISTLDYMRMVVGICILLDGYPLIFFLRETMRLAPGNTAFTAACFAFGLLLMIPFTALRRLYRPNTTMLWLGIGFLLLSIVYMYAYTGDGSVDKGKEMIYYAYVLIFLFLLINIPNDMIPVFIPVVVIFTLLSNLALIYALITDPTWSIGQRATITLNNGDAGSGNPHAFSRNAYMGVVACAIWLARPQTSTLFRLIALLAGFVNIAVLVLTQTRSAIVAFIVALVLFIYFNVRPAQIRAAARGLVRPVPIMIMVAGFGVLIYFFQRYYTVYAVLLDYIGSFTTRNLETLLALLGQKSAGAEYKAVLDDSTANRSLSVGFLQNVLFGHLNSLILGYGYKFLYLDIPILESLTNQGFLGFYLFGGIHVLCIYHSIRLMYRSPNPLNTFLAYFYLLILVQLFTNGRPTDISFWFPLAIMTRFMGVEHLFPAHLSDHAPAQVQESLVVVPNPEPA